MQTNFYDGLESQAVATPIDQADPAAAQQQAATIYQQKQNRMQRYAEYVNSMPEGPAKEKAKQDMATDFGMAGKDAQTDMNRADALRSKAPQGRTAGGVYQAANPLEHIAHAMDRNKSQAAYDTGLEARGAARQGANDTRRGAMDEMLSRPELLRQR